MNMVHLQLVPDDRRARSRSARRRQILDAALVLIAEDGLGAVTMQGVADRLDCAVGTLYNYVPSKAGLVAALQDDALTTLRRSLMAATSRWADHLEAADVEPDVAALVALAALPSFWSAASVVFADEFELARSLLSEHPDPKATELNHEVFATFTSLLDAVVALLDDGVAWLVIESGDNRSRALSWLVAMNGVLLLDRVATLDPHLFRPPALVRSLSHDLLLGWGTSRTSLDVALVQVERLAATGPMAPPPEELEP
jgi:AcrR family transcriptional regulator